MRWSREFLNMRAFGFTFGLSAIMEAIDQSYDLHGDKFSLLF